MKLSRSFSASLPLIFDVLEVADPDEPLPLLDEQRRAALVAFLGHLIQAQSAAAPLVLFIDDAHCIDPDAEALLGDIVAALGWTRTLLLANFRHGYRAAWMDASYYREIALAALPDDDVDELLRRLVGDDGSTDDLRRLIRDRTGGNPFFVEEVVQSLLDHGVLTSPSPPETPDSDMRRSESAPLRLSQPIDDLSIPATVQALLAARLDRMPSSHKLVLQAASVIGRAFSPVVLRHVLSSQTAAPGAPEVLDPQAVDAALAALEGADFIRKDGSDPNGEYAFKHPLTQAVTYGSQLVESRARFHVAVARALQSLHGDHLGQYAALLAHHFGAANWKFEASRWHRRAALRVTSIELGRQRR